MKSLRLSSAIVVATLVAFTALTSGVVGLANYFYGGDLKSVSDEEMAFAGEQTQLVYEAYFDSCIDASNACLERFGQLTPEERPVSLPPFLSDLMLLKPELLGAAIYDAESGEAIASSGEGLSDNALGERFYEEALSNNYINVFNVMGEHEGYAFCLSRYLPYDSDPSLSAVLRLDFDFRAIVSSLSPVRLGEGGRFYIYDKDYRIVYASSPDDATGALAYVKDLVIGSRSVAMGGHHYYLYCSTITSTSWRMAIFVNEDALYSSLTRFLWISLLVGLAAIVIFSVFVVLYVRRLTSSLALLGYEMKDTVSLDFKAGPKKRGPGVREVEELRASYDAMMWRIKELVAALEKEEEEKRQSELSALQNQINPHFLYNALDSIIGLIEDGDKEKAEAMVVSLSRFFRLSLSGGKNIIPLSHELAHVHHYLEIQKMRFGETISYAFEIGEGLDDLYINKLILQPLAENSISHGRKEGETTNIEIGAYLKDDRLHLYVKDDGYGIPAEKLKEIEASLEGGPREGVGLYNVYRRLKLVYGSGFSMDIESEEDRGTLVEIEIEKALLEKKDEN